MTISNRSAAAGATPLRWCPEQDTRDSAVARRNALMGLWAGRAMGLSGDALAAYAAEVHRADFERPGDQDVIAKVAADLHRAGIAMRPTEIRSKLVAFHREALRQTLVTD
jgi:hypothetical protein